MSLVLCLLLLAQEPPRLKLQADHPSVLRHVPFTLTVTSNRSEGEVRIRGLRGGLIVVNLSGGRAVLQDVIADDDVVAECEGANARIRIRHVETWTAILPALLAILLMVFTREIILSLFVGVWSGMWLHLGGGMRNGLLAVLETFDTAVLGALTDRSDALVLIALVSVGGTLGIMNSSGGIKGFVDAFGDRFRTRRAGMMTTWFGGVLLFFDDFTNRFILGNVMRPLTDRLRISREKLAYLVDSTSGPITLLGIVSVWTVIEMGSLVQGHLIGPNEIFRVFLHMVPYSYYLIFSMAMSLFVSWSGRDFGPMLRAETRASVSGEIVRVGGRPMIDRDIAEVRAVEDLRGRWHNAVLPIAGFIVLSALSLYTSGHWNPARPPEDRGFFHVLSFAMPYHSLLWGAMGSGFIALMLAVARRHLSVRQSVEAWLRGAKSMFMGVVVLALAWGLGFILHDLSAGPWLSHTFGNGRFDARWWPLIYFLIAAATSMALPTSWGTSLVLLPVVGAMVFAHPDPAVKYGALASIIGGAVFGNHLSPITDSMIFASMASGSDHLDHAKTQIPYALVCGGAAILCGLLPLRLGMPPVLGLGLGLAAIAGVVFGLGRRVQGNP